MAVLNLDCLVTVAWYMNEVIKKLLKKQTNLILANKDKWMDVRPSEWLTECNKTKQNNNKKKTNNFCIKMFCEDLDILAAIFGSLFQYVW